MKKLSDDQKRVVKLIAESDEERAYRFNVGEKWYVWNDMGRIPVSRSVINKLTKMGIVTKRRTTNSLWVATLTEGDSNGT